MAARETFAHDPSTTVTAGGTTAPVSGTSESWTVTSSAAFPAASTGVTQFHVADPAQPGELVLVTNVSGTTWTVTRGADSTTTAVHASGFTIYQVVAASFLAALPLTTTFTFGSGGGAPSSGTYAAGQLAVDQNGVQRVCTAGGTPGTWARVSQQPWQFYPEDYGALGNGKVIGDVVTNATTTITSASAAFTSADVGKYVMIHGANGATNGPLLTTISSFTNSTTVVLANAAGASVSNCPMVYGTDDVAAINNAVTAGSNYAQTFSASQPGSGGYFFEIMFGARIYVLGSGPVQTGNGSSTPTFNSQVPLPYPNPNGTSRKLIIALTGAGDAGFTQFWGSTTPNVAGAALVSMVSTGSSPNATFGVQSVVGGPTSGSGSVGASPPGFPNAGGGGLGFANVKVAVRNMSVWLPIWTNIRAWNFEFLTQMNVRQSAAHIFAPSGINGGVQPYLNNISATGLTNGSSVGWECPANTNNDDSVMDDVTAEGYELGFAVYDHFTAGRLAAVYCDVCVDAQRHAGVGHLISIADMSAEVYNYGLITGGDGTTQTCAVDIGWSAECTGVVWDVNDSSNYLRGVFHFQDPADFSRGINVNGAARLKIISDQLGPGHWTGSMTPAVPAVPASTTAQQNIAWRDAWVSIHAGAGVTVSVINVDGTVTGLTVAAASSTAVRVAGGKNITLTYAGGTPTWDWWLD